MIGRCVVMSCRAWRDLLTGVVHPATT